MMDFSAARRMMVDGQVRTSDVTDRRLIAAMLDVPRERFVPAEKAGLAYMDLDIPVSAPGAAARYLIKPMVLAKLIQAAEIGEGDAVLDAGCATGYASALLARLAGSVTALEEDASLAQLARKALETLTNVTVVNGPLTGGWPGAAPYDVILLDGATEVVPKALLRQLKDGGRLVCVLGRAPTGRAMIYRAQDGEVGGRVLFDANAPVLPGHVSAPDFVF
jgi:protein-L-isoaspartate(D-aspartate) O-methyltransferase